MSTFLGSTIPAELDPHALPLWRELTAHLADLHSLYDTLTDAELNTIKGNLLQSFLGMEVLPAEIHGAAYIFSLSLHHLGCDRLKL